VTSHDRRLTARRGTSASTTSPGCGRAIVKPRGFAHGHRIIATNVGPLTDSFFAAREAGFCEAFRMPAMASPSARRAGRRPKCTKGRSRGLWGTDSAAGAMRIACWRRPYGRPNARRSGSCARWADLTLRQDSLCGCNISRLIEAEPRAAAHTAASASAPGQWAVAQRLRAIAHKRRFLSRSLRVRCRGSSGCIRDRWRRDRHVGP
jgi:hypothetical protein